MTEFEQIFHGFSSQKVVVIGDLMLDTYMWGKVDRISPEAPVPVVSLEKKEYRIGGAGNVALNAASLGAQVTLLSVTGNDAEAGQLKQMLEEKKISTHYICTSDERITTTKTRIISRSQQMMRVDAEITTDLGYEDEKQLLHKTAACVAAEKPDVLIFEDYNKGVLTPGVIEAVVKLCKANGVITAVDPKRKNFFAYKEVDIFKPNLKEVKEGLNLLVDDVSIHTLKTIHHQLAAALQHHISFITLSEKGVFYQQDGEAVIIPSHLRNIADVSGAGDTVIAVAAMVYAASKDFKLAASMANLAGGLVCEEVGTVAIDKNKLEKECRMLLS
jgi:rfaE bifunctional protein kinase chain/domain